MPAGISIFLLWAAPILLLGIIGGILIATSKKGIGMLPRYRKRRYQKRLALYDKELGAKKVLGKRFEKGYAKENPNWIERLLQGAHIRRYEPKELSRRGYKHRVKSMQKMQDYMDYKGVPVDTPNYHRYHHGAQNLEEINQQHIEPREFSRKEFNRNADSKIYVTQDHSTIATTSPTIRDKMRNYDNQGLFQDTEKSNTFNRLAIYVDEKASVPSENLTVKNPVMYYELGAGMIEHMINSLREDAYPITVSHSVIKDGKEERQESLYSKEALIELKEEYDTTLNQLRKEAGNAIFEPRNNTPHDELTA